MQMVFTKSVEARAFSAQLRTLLQDMSPQLQSEVAASGVSGLARLQAVIVFRSQGIVRPKRIWGVAWGAVAVARNGPMVFEVQPGLDSAEPDLDPVSWHF